MAKIYAPNQEYEGLSAGVRFSGGVAETEDPYLIGWFLRHGYRAEEETPEEPEGTPEEPEGTPEEPEGTPEEPEGTPEEPEEPPEPQKKARKPGKGQK